MSPTLLDRLYDGANAHAPGNALFREAAEAIASQVAYAERIQSAAQDVLDAYQNRFETGTGNYFGPIDDEIAELRTAISKANASASGELREECPDALLPDGPQCPRCGGPRAPSGVDGGSWVHFPRATSGGSDT